jgi:PAS domain S-box-containing protein
MTAGRGGRDRIQRLYYLLAVFNAVTVASSLYVGHQLLDIVRSSVDTNRVAIARLDDYAALGQLAQRVNVPGNRVFADGAVESREREWRAALDQFIAVVERERRSAAALPDGPRRSVTQRIDAVDAAMTAMAASATEVFASLRAGHRDAALGHASAMDERYDSVTAAIRSLVGDLLRVQSEVMDAQDQKATDWRWAERVLAFAVLVMVAGAAGYGRHVSRSMRQVDNEREQHLAALEATRTTLERHSEELDRKVQERTAALATANRELSRVADIVNSTEDAIYSTDRDGIVLTWNPAAARIFGFVADEIIGQSVNVLIPEHLRQDAVEMRRHAWEDRVTGHYDTVRCRKDGTRFPASLTVSPILDDAGQVEALGGILRDITEQMRQRERLIESERRLAEAQETASVGSWELDLQTSAVTWSAQQFRLLGFPPDADQPPTYEKAMGAIHPDDRPKIEAAVQMSIATGEPFRGHHRVVWPDGTVRVVHSRARVVKDASGKAIRVAGTSQDVTAIQRAEQALRKSEERFQLVARATNDALWDWEIRTGNVWWSEGARAIFSVEQPPPTIAAWQALDHPDDADWVRRSVQDFLMSPREVWSAEYRIRRGDDGYAWVLNRGIIVRNKAGLPVRMVGSMIDITERKEAERLKSDFVSFVSHQLRTPLSGMNWMLELAAEAEGLPVQAREYIGEARESAARLGTLVNDLLDIARLESGRAVLSKDTVRLQDVTESVVREMQTVIDDKRHTVTFVGNGVPPVITDSQLIRQVIVNLLSNAIKYTPDGGQIEVQVVPRQATVEWSVRDNGMGIPRAAQARLFEKFYRAENAIAKEAEGTGLGLHLGRLIVEQSGGQMWVESDEGRGATFAFTLPLAQQQGETA